MTLEVRQAALEDAPALGALRWRWNLEAAPAPDLAGRESFLVSFADWMAEVVSSHDALVASDGQKIVGMAWLARVQRLPDPGELHRIHGDLQSVYVLPAYRDAGLGSRLIGAVLEHGTAIGLSLITVQAGRRSLPLYQRFGFTAFDRHLQLNLSQ